MSTSLPTAEIPGGDELVTVGTFNDLTSAGLAKSALESAGIPALLRSPNANSLIPFAFESEVQVRSADEAAARNLLESAEDSPASEAEVLAAEQEDLAMPTEELPGESTED